MEQKQLKKSLACFIKTLYIRTNFLGVKSLGVADCHYNIAVLYQQLNIIDRTLKHYTIALNIRKVEIGKISLPVSNILEKLGVVFI
jgi:hypothetical protein